MLARHGRRLLNLLDDTPVVPGDTRPAFEHTHQARQILNDAEEDLRDWQPNIEPIPSSATELGSNLMPTNVSTTGTSVAEHNDGLMPHGGEVVEGRYEGQGAIEESHHGGQTGVLGTTHDNVDQPQSQWVE